MVNRKTNAPSVPLTTFPLLSLLTDMSSATSHPFLRSRFFSCPFSKPFCGRNRIKINSVQAFPPFSSVFAQEFKHSGTENVPISVSFSVPAASSCNPHQRSRRTPKIFVTGWTLQLTVISEIRQVKKNNLDTATTT